MRFRRHTWSSFLALVTLVSAMNAQVIEKANHGVSVIVLGTVQDGGSPHIGCTRACCRDLFLHPDSTRKVVSLGIIDWDNHKTFLCDATPDMPQQLRALRRHASFSKSDIPDGILLTHAHIGHYTGLMYLGKEAVDASKVPVYAMPKMKAFLEQNGPWSQLVSRQNISLQEMTDHEAISLSLNVKVIPIKVPHRDEYSETVGFIISGPEKKLLFIPDIDKWGKWQSNIIDMIAQVDYAFIDGSFFDGEELQHRDMSEIPHPFIVESMGLFRDMPSSEKDKVWFIHMNHTNPALDPASAQYGQIIRSGFHVARYHNIIGL